MLSITRAAVTLAVGMVLGADSETICTNATGTRGGSFHTFWRDSGSGCMTLRPAGGYSVIWRLGARGNMVAGRGWTTGSPDRVVHYEANVFKPGTNGYLSFYGWSKNPLVEYYVVESWGDFVPPGACAAPLGTITSDAGTYRVYRTRRVDQPSIAGTATFDQYWSVRTSRRAPQSNHTITFANHVAGWRRLGLRLGTLDYQVLATEGYGSAGRSDIRMTNR